MPKGLAPKNAQKTYKQRVAGSDYVGPYDGSKNKWMSRSITDKGGNRAQKMVPVSSKPTEARDYHEGFDRTKWGRTVNKKGSGLGAVALKRTAPKKKGK